MMEKQNEVHRAPNAMFYAVWRGQLICRLGGVTAYFGTEREAWEYLSLCDKQNQFVDLAALDMYCR